ncbi:CASP-like protein 4D2 [Citrus sinensis]|uniref:CASP-like protein 4D2 n=1 Tax=Citrus sinensis TaxID=2711 RepID=A0ACB8M4S2_CITSI|nr:CASP-like protein 4D2 [Citrus sinensis]
MACKAMGISALVLRILTILLSATCIAVFLTDTFKNEDGSKSTFKDVFAYRSDITHINFYFFLAIFFFIHVISFLLASGVGAGFAVTFEFKKVVNFFIESLIAAGIPQAEEARSAIEKFFDKAYIANGLLLGAFACTAVVSVVSSNPPQSTSSGIFR